MQNVKIDDKKCFRMYNDLFYMSNELKDMGMRDIALKIQQIALDIDEKTNCVELNTKHLYHGHPGSNVKRIVSEILKKANYPEESDIGGISIHIFDDAKEGVSIGIDGQNKVFSVKKIEKTIKVIEDILKTIKKRKI